MLLVSFCPYATFVVVCVCVWAWVICSYNRMYLLLLLLLLHKWEMEIWMVIRINISSMEIIDSFYSLSTRIVVVPSAVESKHRFIKQEYRFELWITRINSWFHYWVLLLPLLFNLYQTFNCFVLIITIILFKWMQNYLSFLFLFFERPNDRLKFRPEEFKLSVLVCSHKLCCLTLALGTNFYITDLIVSDSIRSGHKLF